MADKPNWIKSNLFKLMNAIAPKQDEVKKSLNLCVIYTTQICLLVYIQ